MRNLSQLIFCALLCQIASHAQSSSIKVPEGEPMSPNPVMPRSKLVEKKKTFDGVERTWYEYIPESYTSKKAVPLVVAIHGGSADGAWMFKETSWGQIADEVGLIVIYPNGSIGSEKKLRWNGYPEFNTNPNMAISKDNGVDEAKFLRDLIEETKKNYQIDASRVYMHGQSNGGMMTSYFGLRYPEILAAMGVTSAPPSVDVMRKYAMSTNLPTYFWTGETDTLAGQYNPANKSRPVLDKEFAEFWARINKDDPQPKLRLDGPYNTEIYSGNAEVRTTEFRNGIHTLPFTTAYLIWNDFFSRFARGKNKEIVNISAIAEQAAPADKGAVAIKLGVPFALVDNKVVRIGKTPEEEPVLVPGIPSSGVLIPADFVQVGFGGTVRYVGESAVQITTKEGTAIFTVGSTKMVFNGKETALGVSATKVNGEIMISLRTLAEVVLGETLSTRKDVYRNDIYYVNSRAVDLSAHTIAYIDQRLGGKN